MTIKRLPEHIINRIKAWEIVDRPISILKELVENSLDAWANVLNVIINDWWKSLIQVEDNWTGIELSDMDLLLERYATSKIKTEEDLQNISNYWFRWEALASISEVSQLSILSKTKYSQIGTKLKKIWNNITINHQPTPFEHWTLIKVENLFYNVPARLKFLKSSQTEYYYCYNYFVDISLQHIDKEFTLKKNDRLVFDLKPVDNLLDRIDDVFRKKYSQDLFKVDFKNDYIKFYWYVSNPNIRFWSWENIKIYANKRPINDKIIKKALMTAYERQIHPWEYPLAILFIEIDNKYIDVNVHPRKTEVKFLNPKDVFDIVFHTIKDTLSKHQITQTNNIETNFMSNKSVDFVYKKKISDTVKQSTFWWANNSKQHLSNNSTFDSIEKKTIDCEKNINDNVFWQFQIVWQIWNSYIVLQDNDNLYYVDQHALAERISFEKMKRDIDSKKNLGLEMLLQPISIEVQNILDIEKKLDKINSMWFDCSMLLDNQIVVYWVPKIFKLYRIDLTVFFNHILFLELDDINFNHILDDVFASKACKTSIKAWHKLSYLQMENLIKDWFENIDWLFVCQHWRPFFIQIKKKNIDKMFDR